MQFGHIGIALAIASLDPRPETFLVVGAAQFLPNADSLVIRAGWAKPEFHGTWSHSLLFCLATGAVASLLFGPLLGALALASIVAHVAADLPTDTGIPLLLPFSRRRFSLNLWKNTGYWGRSMYAGYYRQPWAWILEGAVFALVAWRYAPHVA
ncbi:MAG: metal-dependent hydrolase [Gemmatimonadales bacterium]